MTRRQAAAAFAASGFAGNGMGQRPGQSTGQGAGFTAQDVLENALRGSAASVEYYVKNQVTDPASPWQGMILNGYGIPVPATMAGMADTLTSALLHKKSKYYRDAEVFARLKLSQESLRRNQSAAGFIDNLDTNFNSPADTAFAVRGAANGLLLAKRENARELYQVLEPFVKSASDGLAIGGIHTPNHRWVLSAALAQANEIIPNPAYVKRIDQWLAEGIDIDEDGQYTERSMGTYNPITDSAFIAMAEKLKRPELFEPVRANLNSLLYLINPNDEIVTDFSRRQDQFTKVTTSRYYGVLHYMALRDDNPVYAGIAAKYQKTDLGLTQAMLYPKMLEPLQGKEAPSDYRKDFKHNKFSRFRRGDRAATVFYGGGTRVASIQKGEAVITAVRFISSFFGKGQFRAQEFQLDGDVIRMAQKLEGPYYQPFTPARKIDSEMWDTTQKQRPRTEISRFEQRVEFREGDGGFDLRVLSIGTKNVPMTIEIAFREGGKLEGVEPVAHQADAYLLRGEEARYRVGKDVIRVSSGMAKHSWTKEMRYIEPKLPGPTLFLTGFAPVDHTIRFRFA
jgi:hypothetical protein